MDDIRIIAKELLDELENIKSGDLDKKNKLQVKMKKIINLSDEIIFSEDLKDIKIHLQCQKDITNVFSFFLKSPDVKDKEKYFL
jgi:hypothetical protein